MNRTIHVRVETRESFGLAVDDQTFRGTTAEFAEAFGLSAGHEPNRTQGRVSDGETRIEWADEN